MTVANDLMASLLIDLEAEHAALDVHVAPLDDAAWDRPSPAAGWTVRHQIAHLTRFDQVGAACIAGDSSDLRAMGALLATHTEDQLSLAVMAELLARPPAELLEAWRTGRQHLLEALGRAPADTRVPWAAGAMSLASFATARLMETWAHGLDCLGALGVPAVDTDRVLHVARIGYSALPYALRRAGIDPVPDVRGLRLDLTAPSGAPWTAGPDAASDVISGPAGAWARVAVQRDAANARAQLDASGPLAQLAVQHARAFA
jgi:uncharacterized protein (TIGR03084 family)